jgi:hypothetical protein
MLHSPPYFLAGQTQSKTEDLKEMGDISSGMSSRVIQIYLKEILNSFLNGDFNVRSMAMRVVEIVLRQGLVHPVQIVPYLICLSTDPETEVCKRRVFRVPFSHNLIHIFRRHIALTDTCKRLTSSTKVLLI